jgi:hypothetical protein
MSSVLCVARLILSCSAHARRGGEENAANLSLADLNARMIIDVCHAACRSYFLPPLEQLVAAAVKNGGLASVSPTDYLPRAAAAPGVGPAAAGRLPIPPGLRGLLKHVIAIDADGCVAVPGDLDAALLRAADARLAVTLDDVQEYFSSQLLGEVPGRGAADVAALVRPYSPL